MPENMSCSLKWFKLPASLCTCSKSTPPLVVVSLVSLIPSAPTDWALKVVTMNLSTTLLHVGGQGDYYNPFTPPPTNQPTFRQWTTGSVYYSTLISPGLISKSGKSKIMDRNANGGEDLAPGYVVYEDGAPTRVLLINYVDDATGAHDVTARIAIGGGETGQAGSTPQQVRVKYFEAPSVSFKGDMTWALRVRRSSTRSRIFSISGIGGGCGCCIGIEVVDGDGQ